MKANTQKMYELAVEANDLFIQQNPTLNTSVGLMDKALRLKGIPADAVTVDVIASKNRLIFVLLDNNIDIVGIGLGNIVEDNIDLVDQINLATLNIKNVSNLLIKYLN